MEIPAFKGCPEGVYFRGKDMLSAFVRTVIPRSVAAVDVHLNTILVEPL